MVLFKYVFSLKWKVRPKSHKLNRISSKVYNEKLTVFKPDLPPVTQVTKRYCFNNNRFRFIS